jgi:hypothetical protein
MHDPMTVAFEIRYPWKKYGPEARNEFERNYRESFITIWHVDPEKDGSDDSCRWFRRKLTKEESAYAERLIDNEIDNLRSYFCEYVSNPDSPSPDSEEFWKPEAPRGAFVPICDDEEMKRRIKTIFSCYIREFRWRYPVRWHFWHWQFQVHPLQAFKRWAFSRCERCGGGFKWGESPISGCWDGTGPLWFRTEKHIHHGGCSSEFPKPPCAETVASGVD